MNQGVGSCVRLCGMGLHRTNKDTGLLFVSLAVLSAVGCYKKEEPNGFDDAGVETETDATAGTMGDDAGTGDGADTNITMGTAEDSSPDGGSEDGDDTDSDTGDGAALEPLIASLCDWEFKCCSDG